MNQLLDTVRHWRGTNPMGCDHEHLVKIANEALAKRLNGEDPKNDITLRERKLAVALDVLRNDIMDAVLSYESGRMSSLSAMELVHDYDKAITAIIVCD